MADENLTGVELAQIAISPPSPLNGTRLLKICARTGQKNVIVALMPECLKGGLA